MVQDAQRQISCVHDSIFDEGYREKCDIVNKSPRAYFKVLGYHSSFDGKDITPGTVGTCTLLKDDTNDIGGLFGIEKQFNENWHLGTFTSFQYADCDFKYRPLTAPANVAHSFDCSTRSAISGLYGRYCKDKWTCALVGSLGYLTFRNDSSELLNRNKYRGWSCALSGQISYNLSSQECIEFGPMVGFDGSYIEEDGYVEFPNNQGMFYKVNDHNVKSLMTFVGAYGKKTFFIKEHKTLAYANAGWSCECLRKGNKYSYERHINQRNDGRQANLPYLPRNTAKVRVGIKSFFNERIEGELAVGANVGSDYYNINGNVAINYQF